uniref:Uncharacterized protein n=1 Tax=Rhizophora mucronata TaxID=61149 RepID=A0A2P2NGX4_RHIMU
MVAIKLRYIWGWFCVHAICYFILSISYCCWLSVFCHIFS